MALFLDASATVKAYVREQGSEAVRVMLARPEVWGGLFLSEVSLVEVPAALTHKYRRGLLSRRRLHEALEAFAGHYPTVFDTVGLTTELMDDAALLVGDHPKRGFGARDAIQLASAQWVTKKVNPNPTLVLVGSDRKLRSVADAVGFDTHDPERSGLDPLLAFHTGLGEL